MHVKAQAVDPIKDRTDVHNVAEYIRKNYENGEMLRLMFLTGCNTGLRAGDIRQVKPEDLLQDSFVIVEKKTGKLRLIYVNDVLRNNAYNFINTETVKQFTDGSLKKTITEFNLIAEDNPAFIGGQGAVIGVKYIHYVIREACFSCGLNGNFGSHTMRKTFAYHCYFLCRDLERVKTILNHSDIILTYRYVNDKRIENRARRTRRKDIKTEMTIKECYGVNLE